MEKLVASILGLLVAFSLNCIQVKCQYSVKDTSMCHFPFAYDGKIYHSCIHEDRPYPWCSLTQDFMAVWDYCLDMTKSDWKCTTDCAVDPNDFTGYPSCMSDSGKIMYCVDQILTPGPKSGSCDKKYSDISPYHSACLAPSRYVARSGISKDEIPHIVEMHNKWRRAVTPTASGMQKIYWDEDYAMVAQKHADRCSFSHDEMLLRQMPGTGVEAGQNIVMVTGMRQYNLTFAFDEMFKGEKIRWNFNVGLLPQYKKEDKNALHYTQIILDGISKVGCGTSDCVYADRVERVYVCNYNVLQNSFQIVTPYKDGPQCSQCPGTCDNGLCDCGGKDCYYGGYLDLSTCKCVCSGLRTGDRCESLVKQEIDAVTGCYNPFLFNGQVYHGCMQVDAENYVCSLKPELTDDPNDIVFCPGAMRKRSSLTSGKLGVEGDDSDVVLSANEFKPVNHTHHHHDHKNFAKHKHHKSSQSSKRSNKVAGVKDLDDDVTLSAHEFKEAHTNKGKTHQLKLQKQGNKRGNYFLRSKYIQALQDRND